MNTACTFPPATQGADGWVSKFPAGFSDGLHSVSVKGTSDADASPQLSALSPDGRSGS